MAYGYNGKILRVDLTKKSITTETPEDDFYRLYMGGRGFIGYYLLNEVPADTDPLGPDNKLIFATGVITGGRIAGSGRSSAGAKSPLTGGFGEGEAGGYWGAELKRTGYDAIIIEGKSDKPVYLWLGSGEPEIKDAAHLWGKTTLETQNAMRKELGDKNIRTALIGIAGENMVKVACILNDITHAYGRTGLGAVMGSKNLKGIAAKGSKPPELADPDKVKEISAWVNENYNKNMQLLGTPSNVRTLNAGGGLPTRNFQEGVFEEADAISGETMNDTILIDRDTCYACPVRCKRVVKTETPFKVNPEHGGPEYETLGALGSNCGIGDLVAVAKGNELCSAHGLDTIGAGTTIAFAMECFERGIITTEDTDGIELKFGNGEAMVKMVEMIAKREGFGDVLAEGCKKAAEKIGKGAIEFAMQSKGQEFPMHMPRYKPTMGMGYAVSPSGADHMQGTHDAGSTDVGPGKIRMFIKNQFFASFRNCAGLCVFLPFDQNRATDLTKALTGWDVTGFEIMKAGERALNMARLYNMKCGFTKADEVFPKRIHEPLPSGPTKGIGYGEEKLSTAVSDYYAMMGWDRETGVPSKGKLLELDLEWVDGIK